MKARAAALAALAAALPGATAGPVQCAYETTAGCSAPKWLPSFEMYKSLYSYCFENCPLQWLADNAASFPNKWQGVVGNDHYFTQQGMPCVDGIPQEFQAQDALARSIKSTFPGARVLEYRITSGVPYAGVVHEAMLDHPEYFVRWTHAPNDNGTICLMPYAEHGTGRPGDNCSWPIIAAAYNFALEATRDWFLAEIIAPTLVYADGAWSECWGTGGFGGRRDRPAAPLAAPLTRFPH
jgi:hypothetical protein